MNSSEPGAPELSAASAGKSDRTFVRSWLLSRPAGMGMLDYRDMYAIATDPQRCLWPASIDFIAMREWIDHRAFEWGCGIAATEGRFYRIGGAAPSCEIDDRQGLSRA